MCQPYVPRCCGTLPLDLHKTTELVTTRQTDAIRRRSGVRTDINNSSGERREDWCALVQIEVYGKAVVITVADVPVTVIHQNLHPVLEGQAHWDVAPDLLCNDGHQRPVFKQFDHRGIRVFGSI